MSENLAHLAGRKSVENNLFEKLIQAGGDPVSLKKLAREYKVGEASTYGAASAYDFIQGDNAGKKAYICNGSSCLCAGTQKHVSEELKKHFSEEEIGHVTCIGHCHENSSFQVGGVNYSGGDIENLQAIVDKQAGSSENYHVESLLDEPILTGPSQDIEDFYAVFTSRVKTETKEALLQWIIDSGLRGRGGAGFPTGIKWRSCANNKAAEKYIVCNADEGDPGAFSDRYLMEAQPHTILFGMLVAGYLCGAQWGVLYIRDEYPQSVAKIDAAIKEFEALDLLSDLDFEFKFTLVRGAGAYICGEETALLRSIEGQRPVVSVRPPFPAEKGLFTKPTIVNNVESFAAVHWILDKGAQAFAKIGRGRSTGCKLISIDSCVNRPGIYEVAMGQSLQSVIEAAGGFKQPIKALHIGGPLGGLVPSSKIPDLSLDFESFDEHGFLLGHASIVGIPESQSIGDYLLHLFEFTAAESCGKCFPCRLGATRGKEMFQDAISGEAAIDAELLDDLLETMEKGSLCALGGGAPLAFRNALEYFLPEMKSLFQPTSLNRIPVTDTTDVAEA